MKINIIGQSPLSHEIGGTDEIYLLSLRHKMGKFSVQEPFYKMACKTNEEELLY